MDDDRWSPGLPSTLDGPLPKLVYLYVRERGETDVDDLHERLDLALLELYPILRLLETKDLVRRRDGRIWVPSQRS